MMIMMTMMMIGRQRARVLTVINAHITTAVHYPLSTDTQCLSVNAPLLGVSSLLKTIAIMTTGRCAEQHTFVVILATIFSNEDTPLEQAHLLNAFVRKPKSCQ